MPLSPMDRRNTMFCELQCGTLSRSVPVCPVPYVCTSDLRFSAGKTLRPDHTRPHPTTLARLASPHLALCFQKILVVTSFPRPLYSALRDDIRSVGLSSLILLATGSPVVAREIDRMHGTFLGEPRRYY